MIYHLIIYRVWTNPCYRLVHVADGKIWDVANSQLAAAPTWGDTDIQLATNNYIGGIPVTIPADLPPGDYDMLFYDAAAPAYTDVVELGKRIAWTGKQLIGLPIDL